MKNNIDQMAKILERNHISLPKGARKTDYGNKSDDHERCHALKAGFSQSQDFPIYFGSSSHMVSSKESFIL